MEKEMKARIVHKHDIEANWLKASGFVPKQGEIIVYDKDSNCPYERIKIGDGINNVNILPFTHDAYSAVTPQDYGAKGDGSTDDTAAFQNALSANRVVFVPGGTYKLSGELVVGDNCQMELAQDVVLNFTQTSGNCITLNRSAFLKGNHATLNVPYGFTGHAINVDTSVHTNVKDVPPFTHWDPQWKTGRYLTDLNICKANSNGLHYSNSGDSNGTAVYVCADGSATSTFIWGMNFSGLRIAGAFEYGVRAVSTGSGYNHEMRIEALMDAVKIGVSLEDCNNAYISAIVQPRAAADGTTYAEHGIQIISSKNTDLSGSRVWDWNEKTSKWENGNIYQHIALYGACAGTILNDFNYHSLPSYVNDIREIIYTDTASNFDSLIILQEPFTRWFKPVNHEPYFNNGSDNERLLLKKEQDALFQTDYIPAFTDQLAKATDGKGAIFNEIGYKKGYGWEIDGVTLTQSQWLTCTGFIPVKHGSVVNVKGMSFTEGSDNCRIVLFDADFNKLMHVNRGLLLEGNNYFAAYTETEDGFTMIPRGRNTIAYVTITVYTSTVSNHPFIAVDEEIAYTQIGTLASGIKVNSTNLINMDGYETKGRMTTQISAESTNEQYPTAKAVYNLVSGAFKEQESVLYVEQTLTEEQKAQARANIGITGTGKDGSDGTSVTITSVTESDEDGGENVVVFSDGNTLTVRNGRGGSGESVPDYVAAEAKETAQKVLSHQSEDCFTLAWLSDLHIGSSYKIDDKWVTDETSVIEAGQGLHEMSKTAPCDMIALGGDLAAGTVMTQHEDGLNQLDTAMEYLRPTTFHTPTLYLVGNHDDVPFRGTADRLTRAEMFSRFGRKNLLAGAVSNDLDKGCNYGYLDFENRKMRVIYLDTHDKNGWESTNQIQGETTGSAYMDACNVSAKQLHWLANVALDFSKKENPSEWGVIVLSHTHLNIHTGNHSYTDATSGKTYTANTDNVIVILTAYLSNGSGSITLNGETATYDFSGLEGKAYLYGTINGHRHCYEYREYGAKKIPGITCPNTHAYGERENPDGSIYPKTPGTGESTTFSVITIDRKNGKIYADNHGAGIDRVFDVMVYSVYNNLVPTAITPPTASYEQPSTEIYNGGLGYMNDIRISGMGNYPAETGYVTTGVMTWRENPGPFSELKPIYIKGAELDITKSYVRMCLIHNINNAGLYCATVMNSGTNWEDAFTIETLGDLYYKLTPIDGTVSWYNIRYFMLSLYGSGENLIITVDEEISGAVQVDFCTVTNQLTNVSTNNTASRVRKDSAYNAIIAANSGYSLDSITVTMGGVDITSTVYNNGAISIASVTDNIVITASASTNVANYTNLVPTAIKHGDDNTQPSTEIYNGVGYMNDMRISGMNNIVEADGYVTTGIMKWRDTSGDYSKLKPIYIKGALLDVSKSYVRAVLIQYTDSGLYAKELIKTADKWNATFTIETLGDMYYKLTPIESGSAWYNIRYFMFSLYGSGENLIITVDEPIE